MNAWTGAERRHRGGVPEVLPLAIESHGFLLGVDAEFGTVEVASTNLAHFVGIGHADALGEKLADALHPAIAALLARVDDTAGPGSQVRAVRLPPPRHPVTDRTAAAEAADRSADQRAIWVPYDVVLHRGDHLWVLEFEPAPVEPVRFRDVQDAVRRVTDHAGRPDGVLDLCSAVAHEIRLLTGADRVRVHRLAADPADPAGAGTDLAEDRRAGVGPSTPCVGGSVPAPERDRYRRLLPRSVADVDDRPVGLVCSPGSVTGSEVDPISLRSESPASRDQLRRRGVAAVLTIPLVVEGELWGLICCSHGTALRIPPDRRSACVLLGQLLSFEVQATMTRDELRVHRTRLAHAEQELSAAGDRLTAATADGPPGERADRHRRLESLGQLAGAVAHDINNLLAVIGASAEFAAEEVLAEARSTGAERWATVAADLEQVQLATRHAGQLTQQLLAFARSDPSQPVAVDLNAAITSLGQLLRRTLGDGVDLVADLDPHLPPFLADPGQVEQILVNLAVNARDAMPHGGRLVLSTTRVAPGVGRADTATSVRLEVTDSGTGMTQAVLDRAFEPFFTTKPSGRGTGLGLATVHGIVTRIGGTVTVGSRPGQGTRFTLTFPATATVPPAGRGHDVPGRRGGATILVVDDREELRDLTTRVLRDAGYDVLTATDGPTALTVAVGARPRRVDLLLSDLRMPRMGGDELAARLTADHPGLRVLFMSGFDAPSSGGAPSHRHPVVDKPFTRAGLLAAVAAVLETPAPDGS